MTLALGHNSHSSNTNGSEDMEKEERPALERMNQCEKGHVLLAALMLIVLLGIAGMTSYFWPVRMALA